MPAAAIVGIYEHPSRLMPSESVLRIKAHCAAHALRDAGLAWSQVDAVYDVGEGGGMIPHLSLLDYLRIRPKLVSGVTVGGSSHEALAGQAARDIAAGRTNVALITYGSRGRSGARPIFGPTPATLVDDPWGNTLIGSYAMAMRRHMHQYGTTSENLAEIAVATRHHAVRSPTAMAALAEIGFKYTGELTIDDVLQSRVVADPLHALDCCIVSDGGGAVIIASKEVARDCRTKPVWILGSGDAAEFGEFGRDLTVSAGAVSGPTAFGEAGVRPDEIDIAMCYDSFTYTVLTALEDLGFCAKGEGGQFVSGGRLAFDSGLRPSLNTDGGGLSSNHPGMRGIFLLIEATRQLRGESTSQVDGAKLAVAHGNGGYLGGRHFSSTVVLGA